MTSRRRLFAATILAVPMVSMIPDTDAEAAASRHHTKAHGHSAAKTAAPAGAPATAAVKNKAPLQPYHSSANEEVAVRTNRHASVKRKARESTSSVSIVTSETLQRAGQINLADALTKTYASVNVEAMGSDAAALVSSIHMRGLSSNHVVVLLDGHRRHTTGNMTAVGGPNFGTTGVDLNMIPSNMIDHMEIMEDGAAPRYGGDALAGVINIITKKTNHGLSISGQTGANAYNGDGWNYQLNADGGFKLGNDGFLHLFGQMYHADHFVAKNAHDHRLLTGDALLARPSYADSGLYTGPVNLPDSSNKITSTPEETRENFGLDWEKPLNENVTFFGSITYAHRHSEAYENFRLPTIAPSLWPYGFSPLETIEENDYAATVGARGNNFLGFKWSATSTYGADYNKIGNKHTANPNMLASTCSLDPSSSFYSSAGCGWSPTTALAQKFNMAQWTNDLDFSRRFRMTKSIPVDVSFGMEHRLDSYQMWAGNAPSYILGGTQGFAGLMPANAGKWYRNVWSWYLDGTFHFTKNWVVDFAGRFEHYTDAGNAEIGKVSTRYDVTKWLALRGTINNGFRAPTLAEQHYSSMNVGPTSAEGLLAADSDAARAIGGGKLKAERSTNVSGGIVVEPLKDFNVEVNVYQTDIRDRIGMGNVISGPSAINALSNLGFERPAGVSDQGVSAYSMVNAGSTRTQGLDITADYTFRMRRYGNLNLSMSLDLNRTRMHHTPGGNTLNAQTIGYLTTAYPRSKIILNAYYNVGKWDVNIRQTRWGQTTNMLSYQDWAPAALQYSTTDFYQFKNTPRWLTDLEVGYRVNKQWHLAVGANNIFNIRPRRVPNIVNYLGAKPYDISSSQISMTGAYYYGRINANF
ncbi:TonB-dependent receptor [Acetobacter sp. AN02]|uniref:TonB-dependent receptor plug domain-containing protein n=1 Tax=Acetobacter sp. AN02 TaxID=2894186 RepID=UPI00243463F9|nr:TonB-dependent receptor [Acetobacter sp. AN02]MDG6093741.1 TonB-dependent receptor [Acetobacter sp. AN02]